MSALFGLLSTDGAESLLSWAELRTSLLGVEVTVNTYSNIDNKLHPE